MSDFNDIIVDMHCHPALKPFGQHHALGIPDSIQQDILELPPPLATQRNSIWHYDNPTFWDKFKNALPGNLIHFSQSDFTSIAAGNVRVVTVALYPLERGFVDSNFGTGKLTEFVVNLTTMVGKPRIKRLQEMEDYFSDLEKEYAFYRWWDGKEVDTHKGTFKYCLSKNYAHLMDIISKDEHAIGVVFSIEGGNVLNTGMGKPIHREEVLQNVDKIKAWSHKPLYMTYAHHFYNNLCGHAESMNGISNKLVDQSEGLNEGITPLGFEVLDRLLDKEKHRILIDIKHMSVKSRQQYLQYLKENYQYDPVPLIVSHGAATGTKSYYEQTMSTEMSSHLYDMDINFFDDEILEITRSGGLFCLQIDERRIASKAALKQASGKIGRKKVLFHRAKLVWNNIQHVAEVLDRADFYPWGTVALGSDYDGIVNPLNGYWTAEDLKELDTYLLMHAYDYMEGKGKYLSNGSHTDPEEIVSRFLSDNAMAFLEKHY
ncbi:membrane dipeptidase [Algivirga pacifica]|uniref:Peptidase M19 n=1 Tax=Algivirga pacifica TaxID=1162670 RepID=A0ABP9DLF8_9BACT